MKTSKTNTKATRRKNTKRDTVKKTFLPEDFKLMTMEDLECEDDPKTIEFYNRQDFDRVDWYGKKIWVYKYQLGKNVREVVRDLFRKYNLGHMFQIESGIHLPEQDNLMPYIACTILPPFRKRDHILNELLIETIPKIKEEFLKDFPLYTISFAC